MVLVFLQFKDYVRLSNKSWTRNSRLQVAVMLRGLSQWLLSYQLLPYLPSLFPTDTRECEKMNVPEAALGFQQATASLLSAAGKSERQGTTRTSHGAREACGPWADCNRQVRKEGNQLFPAHLSPSLPKRGEA